MKLRNKLFTFQVIHTGVGHESAEQQHEQISGMSTELMFFPNTWHPVSHPDLTAAFPCSPEVSLLLTEVKPPSAI